MNGNSSGSGPIRLACLDMAGTTVRDDGMVERAFVRAIGDVGASDLDLDAALAYVRDTMGQSKIVVFRALFDGDEQRAQSANVAFERAYAEACARGEAEAIPGAVDAMRALHDAGVLVCLTTGFAPDTRDALLSALAWDANVDLALSPADAGRGRPWPDMILTAVMRLDVDDVRTVAVAGDTTNDLLAGTRAGASIVAGVLTGAHTEDELNTAPHTHIIESVASLPQLIAKGPR